MKTFTFILIGLSIALRIYSQSPSAFNYQAVLRNTSGNVNANADVAIRIELLHGSVTGTAVYAETFAVTTNAFGLVNLQVGKGTPVSGTFDAIDWSAGPYFIKVSVNGTEMSTTQLLSVPYAMYAAKAGNGFSGSYNDLTGKPVLFSGSYNDLTNKPALFTGNYSDLAGKPNLANVAGTGSYHDLLNRPDLADTAKYLKKENDPLFGTSVAKSIKASDTVRWSTEYVKINRSKATMAVDVQEHIINGNSNTSVGIYAHGSNTVGNSNAAFGDYSLCYSTSGSSNSAMGSFAMYRNISGHRNTAVGMESMFYNSTGNENTAAGYSSLSNNIAGRLNVAVGTKSLYSNTSGNENVSVGSYALWGNKTGQWNTAIGDSALVKSNTDKNTAVGYKALMASIGWDNTAVGFNSLVKNSGGFDNVAIGMDALNSNVGGNGNTAIGKYTLVGNVSGSNNTAVGYHSDVAGNASNSSAIGYDAYVNSSNKVVIGNINVTSIGGYAPWTNYSDARLKENIVYNSQLGLNFITGLRTVSYNYKADQNKRVRNGLIAQDVQFLLQNLGMEFSGLVMDDNPEHTLNISYAEFVMPLINSVQELNEKNRQLQQKNEILEQTLNQMKTDLEEIKKSLQN